MPSLPPDNTTTRDTNISTLISSPCTPVTLHFLNISYRIKLPPPPTSTRLKLILKNPNPVENHPHPHPQPQPQDRIILNNITGMVTPGSLLAILGPSGSGKSTLLSILAGRLKHSGSLLANGQRFTKTLLKKTAFVAQDDLLYPHLTVRETLLFCALLRLPGSVPRADKVSTVESVINELNLNKCADTCIGNAFVRGVSGGERKRVSIGHEMLINPSLLLLDEPTSGLDSTAAGRLVATLGGLAKKGRTVITSVHQPASRVYQMFDSVMLLSEGNCVYFGKGSDAMDYFQSVGFVPRFHVNPADFMLDLANGVVQIEYTGDSEKSNVKQSLLTSYNRELAPKVKASVTSTAAVAAAAAVASGEAARIGSQRSSDKEQKDYSRISWFSQFTILLHRGLKERWHESFNTLRVFQVIATALLGGSMWWHSDIHNVQDRLGLLFFISIFWGVFASFNAVFTFPQERAIFIKERASGMYTLSSYFMARMVGDLPMELVLPTVFAFILFWMTGIKAFILTLTILLSYVLVAQGLGLLVGASIMDAKQASTLVTVIMLAFLLTGGFYVQHVPSCMNWLKYTSFTFYGYRLLIGVQYRGEIESFLGTSQYIHGNGSQVVEIERQASVGVSIGVLVAMFVGYRILAYLALRRIKG